MDVAFHFGNTDFTQYSDERKALVRLLGALRSYTEFSNGSVDVSSSLFCFWLVNKYLSQVDYSHKFTLLKTQWVEESISGWFFVSDKSLFDSTHQNRWYFVVKNIPAQYANSICHILTRCQLFEGAVEVKRRSSIHIAMYFLIPRRLFSLYSKFKAVYWVDYGTDFDRGPLLWLRRIGFVENELSYIMPSYETTYFMTLRLTK